MIWLKQTVHEAFSRAGWRRFTRHVKYFGITYVLMGILYCVWDANYFFGISLTKSLPYNLYLVRKNSNFEMGDLIAFKYKGLLNEYERDSIFIKRVQGLSGDAIESQQVSDDVIDIHVNGVSHPVELKSRKGAPLHPIADRFVKPDNVFVSADHPRSFDSRYAEQGLVERKNVIGSVIWKW